jgi:hypothetical protein
MLIETDKIDWKLPIVWYDLNTNITLPAVVVSTNMPRINGGGYNSSNTTKDYGVMVYDKVGGDKLYRITAEGKEDQRGRRIFNTDGKHKDTPVITDQVKKNIKELGVF